VGSISNEVIEFFQLIFSFQPHYDSGVDSTSNRNEYQNIFLGGKVRPALNAGNLTII
jgi:hypothetical protein